MGNPLKRDVKNLFKRGGSVTSLEDVQTPDEFDEETEQAPEPVVLPPYAPRMPEINIIPEYVLEDYRAIAIRTKFITVVAILALVFAGLFVYQKLAASNNEQLITSLNTRTAELNTQVRGLKVYEQYQQGVLDKRRTIGTTMNTDISLGQIAETINSTAQANNIQITGMAITVNSDPTAGTGECVNPDPFTTTSSVGCITFTGTANDRSGVEGFLASLENTSGLVIPYIPNYVSGEGEGGNAISGSVAFTEEFQSQRYADLLTPFGEEAPADTEEAPIEGEEVTP